MNIRDYKQYAPGTFYHIFNRGTAKMNIFSDPDDYKLFLDRIIENIHPINKPLPATKYGYVRKTLPNGSYDLLSYCLMPNHFHLLIRQNTEVPISKLITKVCTSYSKCFNKKYNRVGPLFQDQFKAVIVESNEQLMWLSAYIHLNPIEAGLVSTLNNYAYNSYLEYAGLSKNEICEKKYILDQCENNPETYVKNILSMEEIGIDPTLLIDQD